MVWPETQEPPTAKYKFRGRGKRKGRFGQSHFVLGWDEDCLSGGVLTCPLNFPSSFAPGSSQALFPVQSLCPCSLHPGSIPPLAPVCTSYPSASVFLEE